jgi:hypothetical protein
LVHGSTSLGHIVFAGQFSSNQARTSSYFLALTVPSPRRSLSKKSSSPYAKFDTLTREIPPRALAKARANLSMLLRNIGSIRTVTDTHRACSLNRHKILKMELSTILF